MKKLKSMAISLFIYMKQGKHIAVGDGGVANLRPEAKIESQLQLEMPIMSLMTGQQFLTIWLSQLLP
jgi:hypothetical protein